LFGTGRLFPFSLILFSVFLSSLSAQPVLAPLEQCIEEAFEEWNIPGMSVAIVKEGEVVLSKGYGVLEAGKEQAADGGSVYAIASNTKAFIATAIGILVEEGKLNWDDPVRKHLPNFALYDEYVSEHTTVEDLLCHRVGLGTFSGDVIWYKSTLPAGEIVRRTRYVPQAYEFRAGYGYSNLMFIAAGEVIRAVTGESWDAFIKRRIFDPLGMDRTRTSVDDLVGMDNIAMPHKPVNGENMPIPYVNRDNVGAAGGVLSSVDDMAEWLQLQLDQGLHDGEALFSPFTQERLWTPHNSFRVSGTQHERYGGQHYSGYGLGWRLFDYGGRMVVSHGGGYDGMYSRVALMPEENLGLVVLTNSMKGISTALMYRIFDHFLEREATDWSKQGLDNYLAGESRRADYDLL
jgi:CubicO group peptidase (beta-lactamase class C family)